MKDKITEKCILCKSTSVSHYYENTLCSICIRWLRSIRMNIHSCIYNSIKYGMESYIWKHLSYNVLDLRAHLERQFEPWMNWGNQGKYLKKNWDDNDSSTWTWQIDHIIPQAAFLFTSANDEMFKYCWSLNNLRPLSSKENIYKRSDIYL